MIPPAPALHDEGQEPRVSGLEKSAGSLSLIQRPAPVTK
jgi:hypothetical protein